MITKVSVNGVPTAVVEDADPEVAAAVADVQQAYTAVVDAENRQKAAHHEYLEASDAVDSCRNRLDSAKVALYKAVCGEPYAPSR